MCLCLNFFKETHSTPVMMKFGLNGTPKKLVFVCTSMCNDNAEQFSLLGMHWSKLVGPCRLCVCARKDLDTTSMSINDPSHRKYTASDTMDLILRCDAPFKHKLQSNGRGKRHKDEDVLDSLKALGINPGYNPLFEQFEDLQECGITDIFSAGTLDNLHTLNRGPVEFAFKWTLTVISLLHPDDNMEVLACLDDRMRQSCTEQSVNPFRTKRKYPNGVTNFFNAADCNDKTTSSIGGVQMEAQEMPDALFWLLFAVGTHNYFLPNKQMSSCGLRNPRKVVCTAICAVLEIVWCLRQRKVPISYVPYIQDACNNAHAKLMDLFMTKQALLGTKSTNGSWKSHGVTHIPQQVRKNTP
jgi:hypothetical protein